MGTLTVKSSSLTRKADYVDANSSIVMNLDYQLDEASMTLKQINGSIYKTPGQDFAGSFNGTAQVDGTISYTLSEVKLSDIPVVYTCLSDIVNQINDQEGGAA